MVQFNEICRALTRKARYNGAPKSLFAELIFYLLHLPLTVTLLNEIEQGAELRKAQARFDNNSNDLTISRSILSTIFEGSKHASNWRTNSAEAVPMRYIHI